MNIVQKLLTQKVSVHFVWLRDILGECSPVERVIFINLLEHTNPLRTFLHELIHLYYPNMSERKVRFEERRLWAKLTQREMFLLGKKLFMRKWDSGGGYDGS